MDGQQPQDDESTEGQKPEAMQIGPVPFLGVLVFGILILIPGTRSFGIVMMLLLAVPILIGWVRARKLADGSRGLTSANATICGLMVLVGAAMSPASPSAPTPMDAAAVAPAPQAAAPPAALMPIVPPAPAVQPQPFVTAPQPALAPAPAKAMPPAKAAPAPAPAPVKTKPRPTASSCAGDVYTNSDGNCVHRPTSSPSESGGATAKCKDGQYSYSQHRQGTCSGHGGVANWL
jgi:outer membrane biosynthesis protein TonB